MEIAMSGKRHHFIPQFLLKGFKCKETDKGVFTFIIRKGTQPIEANTKNIAVKSKFYEYNGKNSDDIITENESNYAKAIREIITNKSIPIKFKNDTVSFIESLVIRTKYFRDIINFSTHYLIDKASEDLLEDVTLTKIINKVIDKNDLLEKYIDDFCTKNKHVHRQEIERLFREKFKHERQHIVDMLRSLAKEAVPNIFTLLKERVLPEICTAQIDALSGTREATARFKRLSGFNWQIKIFEDNNLILGDIGPIAIEENGDVIHPIFSKNMLEIILPISPSIAIIGYHTANEVPLNSSELNTMSASLSLDFIVSSRNSPDLPSYAKMIGARSEKYYTAAIDNLSKR